jgi:hypothetical protein
LANALRNVDHGRRARICLTCGASFVAHKPSAKARRGEVREGRFCSRKCWHAVMRVPVQLPLFKQPVRNP